MSNVPLNNIGSEGHINRKAVRGALKSLDNNNALGEHALACLAIVDARRQDKAYNASDAGRGSALRQVLLEAIETLKPSEDKVNPGDKRWRAYFSVTETYIHGRNREYLTAQMGIELSTYQHELATALDRLVTLLQEQEEGYRRKSTTASDAEAKPQARREDWGEARDVSAFRGRGTELNTLQEWILKDGCRLIGILGIGGIGKTALLEKLAKQITDSFEYVIWRSLVNAPEPGEVLNDIIRFVADEHQIDMPTDVEKQIALLIDHLRNSRCLIILDNVESILSEGHQVGRYRDGYEAYGHLIQCIGERVHQSCLMLTSREKMREIGRLAGTASPVRILHLEGLGLAEAQEMLTDKGLSAGNALWNKLVVRYAGNPLALKIAAETIHELFEGDVARFLNEDITIFGGIRELLDQQFQRLSGLEQDILYWLAIEREATTTNLLLESIIQPVSKQQLIEELRSLHRRSLVEQREGGFSLQNMVMEYTTDRFVSQLCHEISSRSIKYFNSHALIKAQAKDYVRQSQIRLILKPVADRLIQDAGNPSQVITLLKQIVSWLQRTAPNKPGFAAGNILNLLCYMNQDITGSDFSHLAIWQAYVPNTVLHHVNFAYSDLTSSVFAETFGVIASVTFSPNGKFLAAGSATGEIRLWNVDNYRPVSILRGHDDWVLSIAFSENGELLASGSEDQTILLWDVATCQIRNTLRGHKGRVRSVALSSDGRLLASGSDDSTVLLWDTQTGERVGSFSDHTKPVMTVAFSHDGQILASAGHDETIRIWNLTSGQCLRVLTGHSGTVYSIAISSDNSTLVSGGEDYTVRLWDILTGECPHVLNGHTLRVKSVSLDTDGIWAASGSSDHTIRLWDALSGQHVRTFVGHADGLRSVTFSPDGRLVASGGEDYTVRLWDIPSGQCDKTLQGYTNWITAEDFSPDGCIIATCTYDTITLFDTDSGEKLKNLCGNAVGFSSVAFSPHKRVLASGSYDHLVLLWDWDSGECITTLHGHHDWVRTVVFSPTQNILATGGADCTIILWDVHTRQSVMTLDGHTDQVLSVAFYPSGNFLVSASYDHTLKIWDTKNGECIRTLSGHTDWIRTVTYSNDANIIASGCDDRTVRLWDATTGQLMKTLKGHNDRVRSVAFIPDNDVLISGSEDQTIKLWDLSTGECLKTLYGHTDRVTSMAVSPAENVFASGSDDGTVILWDMGAWTCISTLKPERPYEYMNIVGATGLTEAQKKSLEALGAVSRMDMKL